MADYSAHQGAGSLLRLSSNQAAHDAAGSAKAASSSRTSSVASTSDARAENGETDTALAHVLGLALLLGGVLVALAPLASWAQAMSIAPAEWATDSGRWIGAGLLVLAGLSTLRSRPIFVVLTAMLFALTAYGCDSLFNGRISTFVNDLAGSDVAAKGLALAATAFAFLVHARAAHLNVPLRGAMGLVIIVVACIGLLRGWFDWSQLAARLGPGPAGVLSKWGEECTWATILVLTALGVCASRGRPICFLNAILLAALAFYCVKNGFAEVKEFSSLAKDGVTPTVEFVSYKNVELWRWVVGAELACLALVLLHLSLGMGGLTIVCAIAWVTTSLAIDQTVGRLMFFRTLNQEITQGLETAPGAPGAAAPLAGFGLPLRGATGAARSTTPGATAGTPERVAPATNPAAQRQLEASRAKAATQARQIALGAVIPLVWLYFTAILAGLIAAVGLHILVSHYAARFLAAVLLMAIFGIGAIGLWTVWPRDPTQSWLQWFSAWRLSRYQEHAVWLTFLGSTALFSLGALQARNRSATWIHAAAAGSFIGTAATLVAAQMMIYFGGFSPLPAWVYAAIAAGQSSMGWVLLAHQNFSARRAGPVILRR